MIESGFFATRRGWRAMPRPIRRRKKLSTVHAASVVFAGLALAACAHSPAQAPKNSVAASTQTSRAYRPSTLEEHPELTPEEVGHRFLKLIDSLKSLDDISDERIQKTMRLPMVSTPETFGSFLTMSLPESGWQYSFSYRIDPKYRDSTNAKLEFHNEKERIDRSLVEDMGPVCTFDFNAYEKSLHQIGFKSIDSTYDEIGRLIALHYMRDGIHVQIGERREANTPDGKLKHACVESISINGL
jgi:hypothetical protein